MTVKERLTQYIRHEEISVSAFCKKIGVSTGFVGAIRKSIQPDKIESIAINFPNLNISWLVTGLGDMLKENGTDSMNTAKRRQEEAAISENDTLGLMAKSNVVLAETVQGAVRVAEQAVTASKSAIEAQREATEMVKLAIAENQALMKQMLILMAEKKLAAGASDAARRTA